jgi:hypothetical protein
MFEFYSTFGLRDLSYEDAHKVLKSLQEKKKDVDREIVKEVVKNLALPTLAPTTS